MGYWRKKCGRQIRIDFEKKLRKVNLCAKKANRYFFFKKNEKNKEGDRYFFSQK